MVTPRRRAAAPLPQRVFWASVLVLAITMCVVVASRFHHAQESPQDPVSTAADIAVAPQPGQPAPARPASPDLFIASDTSVTTIVNKKHVINPQNYVPGDLTKVGTRLLRKDAADALVRMQNDSGANIFLEQLSCFRSYEDQARIYASEVSAFGEEHANTVSAKAGHSEHQLGLAVDFSPMSYQFADTSSFAWLTKNAYTYGYILRYPADKTDITGYSYEPWHWRYVGVEVATDMHNRNITTLEQYYGVTGGGYN
ncbi:MAG: M15 family metallopeptidase [Propionibacteriaceae bacterium]